MDWFRRYGIPGAYSMGLTFVWLAILYPCNIDLSEENTLKVLGGIFAGGFLPFGYLMCMIGNAYYYVRCCLSSKYGRHARARHIANAISGNTNPNKIEDWAVWAVNGIKNLRKNLTVYWLVLTLLSLILWLSIQFFINNPNKIALWVIWAARGILNVREDLILWWIRLTLLSLILWLISWILRLLRWLIRKINKNFLDDSCNKETVLAACSVVASVSDEKEWNLNKDKHVQEWVRKRSDIVVMNQAIMAGTIVCSISVAFLNLLPKWSWQPYEPQYWKWFLGAVICLQIIIWHVTSVVRTEMDIAIAGVFNLRERPLSSEGTVTPAGQNNNNQEGQPEEE